MAPKAAPPLVGTLGPAGLQGPRAPLVARVGGEAAYRRILRSLTVVATPLPGRPRGQSEARYAFHHARAGGGATIVFPRSKAPVLAAALDRVEVEPALAEAWASPRPLPPSHLRAAQELYPYQEAAVAHLQGLERPEGGWTAYLQMGTGLGKTRVGLAAAVGAGGPVFVVVPTLILRTQWFDEARRLYPGLVCAAYANPPARRPRGEGRPPPGPAEADLVVGILDTVRKKAPGFFSGYAMVVLDEAHELHSRCSQQLLWLAQGAPRVLGLSATPAERPDGLDRLVAHFLGPPLYAETDIPRFDVAAVVFRGLVREVEYVGEAEYVETVTSAAGTVSALQTIGNVVRAPDGSLRVIDLESACATAAVGDIAYSVFGNKVFIFFWPRPEVGKIIKSLKGIIVPTEIISFAAGRKWKLK